MTYVNGVRHRENQNAFRTTAKGTGKNKHSRDAGKSQGNLRILSSINADHMRNNMQHLETEERTQKTTRKNEKSQFHDKNAKRIKEQETPTNIGNTLERTIFHG